MTTTMGHHHWSHQGTRTLTASGGTDFWTKFWCTLNFECKLEVAVVGVSLGAEVRRLGEKGSSAVYVEVPMEKESWALIDLLKAREKGITLANVKQISGTESGW